MTTTGAVTKAAAGSAVTATAATDGECGCERDGGSGWLGVRETVWTVDSAGGVWGGGFPRW